MSNLKLFFSNFFTKNYLFDSNPSYPFKLLLPLLIFYGLIFLLGLFIPIWINYKYKKFLPYKNVSYKIQTVLLSFSIIGGILLFFRFEEIPYLSSRVLVYLLFLSFIIWLIFFIKYLKKQFKKDLYKFQSKVKQLKYLNLPKKEIKKWLRLPWKSFTKKIPL